MNKTSNDEMNSMTVSDPVILEIRDKSNELAEYLSDWFVTPGHLMTKIECSTFASVKEMREAVEDLQCQLNELLSML